jgi:hypothetical protein
MYVIYFFIVFVHDVKVHLGCLAFLFVLESVLFTNVVNSTGRYFNSISSMDVQATQEYSSEGGSDSKVDFIFRVPTTGNFFAWMTHLELEAEGECKLIEVSHFDDSIAVTDQSLSFLSCFAADDKNYISIIFQVRLETHDLVAIISSKKLKLIRFFTA